MKNLAFGIFTFSLFLVTCAKKEPTDLYPQDMVKASYDTIAVDSFSNGAASVDIVRQIRMSSQKYQDSMKAAIKLQAEEKRIKDELDKENKKKLDMEKKKAEEEKKQKASETSPSTQTN
ncbi:hypothetical protein ACM39_01195 [Chryseobacterium sp. FH2]|uniref:hypothetical protein n=1 Tax=Chryseobacterium sp. FH2 TaxID=1674291 RepID=UPI00065AE4BD|nr:hypothetical protein [Chryseobacterium sp. FH2]KMQ69702.1 hypothetical protein ACM39_01195 [Chryseobacterium sp. FH2]